MPTLRDEVKRTLAAREPSATQAKRDLDDVLARARGRRPRRWAVALVPAMAVAAVVVFFVLRTPRAPVAPVSSGEGVHLYVRVSGEPEANALTLDLGNKGEL